MPELFVEKIIDLLLGFVINIQSIAIDILSLCQTGV